MPKTRVLFYREAPADVPVLAWLLDLRKEDRRAYAKCVARIRRLEQDGHELRRPEADYLRDGIYELRVRRGRVNYRLLYFFHGQNVAILGHALTKEDAIPRPEIDRVIRRREKFLRAPKAHSHEAELADG